MTLYEYCDAINARLELKRYPSQTGRWTAKFGDCEVKTRSCLEGAYGNGTDPISAMQDYVKAIEGKCIVFNAYTPARCEFTVPYDMEVPA